ncbi:MAG: DUF1127 domain-containing protein [Trichloromonadaceae bacterium]
MMLFRLVGKFLAKIRFWKAISTSRAELDQMSDELLNDIGISRVEAAREASRPFWDTAPVKDIWHRNRPPSGPKPKNSHCLN